MGLQRFAQPFGRLIDPFDAIDAVGRITFENSRIFRMKRSSYSASKASRKHRVPGLLKLIVSEPAITSPAPEKYFVRLAERGRPREAPRR